MLPNLKRIKHNNNKINQIILVYTFSTVVFIVLLVPSVSCYRKQATLVFAFSFIYESLL